jgi:hypothetical protein
LVWTKTVLGYIVNDFFTNSSGYPGRRPTEKSHLREMEHLGPILSSWVITPAL